MILSRVDDALSVCYDICRRSVIGERLSISKEQFIDNLSNCDIFGIINEGETVGCVFFEPGGIMHVAVDESVRGSWTHKIFRQAVEYGLFKYQRVVAMVHDDNKAAQRLAPRTGFQYAGHDNNHQIWVLQ